jgi:hypothetical protein
MKNNKMTKLLPLIVAMGMSTQAAAAITLYDQDQTTFSVDGLFNTFYVSSKTDGDTLPKQSESRIKMGFLPNVIGFNFGKQMDDLKVGGRSSFWVSINDTDPQRDASAADAGTGSLIDVRQFYATVDGSFGQVLLGKDFALFNRSNILGDEILLGFGQTMTTGDDGGNVSFGNIGTGYLYPFPNSQITYRTPDMGGLNIAVGVFDPAKRSATSVETSPRLETEITYAMTSDDFSGKVWVGGMTQKSKDAGDELKASGTSYGLNLKAAGFALTASGFTAKGVGAAGLGHLLTADGAEVDGTLVQLSYTMGAERFVLSKGQNSGGTTKGGSELDLDNKTAAIFHSVNSNLTLVGEFNKSENDTDSVKTVALGAVVTF